MSSPQLEPAASGRPALAMLHGWGMHSSVWATLAADLAREVQVYTPDLPGYGDSPACAPYSLDHLARQLWTELPPRVHLLGWSMGAKVALRMALIAPQRVQKLILIAATPSFRERADWAHGLSDQALADFARGIEADYERTVQRFLSLQARSGDAARAVIAQLRGTLMARGLPAVETLRGGLDILAESDLRAMLPNITQPCLVLQGSHDTLVPLAAGRFLARTLAHARLEVISGAAHAPFLSHPAAVAQCIKGFLND